MDYKNKKNSLFGKKIVKPHQIKINNIITNLRFDKLYLLFSLIFLFSSVVFWSLLGSKIQSGNADQIVNSQLFSNTSTFQNATLPSQHTFLIKWPIFYLVQLFGTTKSALMVLTVITVLLTVGLFVLILRSIEKRPVYLGTVCIALASVLMLIPAQPYPGGLLPVNMAMIATRNLEYVLYIFSLMLLIRSPRLRSVGFWVATALLGILISSDKLFLTISLGGALVAMVYYGVTNKIVLDNLVTKWLIMTIGAGVGSLALLWAITAFKITHITSQVGLEPYGIVKNLHTMVLGFFYGVGAIFTNLGANPASQTTVIRSIPRVAVSNLFSWGMLSFIVNISILLLGCYIAYRLIKDSLTKAKATKISASNSNTRLAVILSWTTIATLIIFVGSNHDYSVDARYMGIALFSIFVSITAYYSKKKFRKETLVLLGLIMSIGILFATFSTWHSYKLDMSAMSDQNNRNQKIADILEQHKTNVLVGDYWRTVPIKLDTEGNQMITPLSDCTTPREVLSSTSWQKNLNGNSFAYLLSISGGNLTDFPQCSVNQVTTFYGKPSSTEIVEGTPNNPKEYLLFYDGGIVTKTAKKTVLSSISTISPTDLVDLPEITCDGPTAMNIVAHEDDDLLFMNPDIIHDLQNNYCERTIYVTAGDAGAGSYYYLSREKGSEAAYSEMTGSSVIWVHRTIAIGDNEYVTLANPKGDTKISLVFFHLPDGGLNGQGYKQYNYESIDKLLAGNIKSIRTVDGQSTYNLQQFKTAIYNLMVFFGPSEIRTQSTYSGGSTPFKDHPDHNAVGSIISLVAKQYNQEQYSNLTSIPIKYYEGYPIRNNPVNVSGIDLQNKRNAFFSYSNFDGSTCNSVAACSKMDTYSNYLQRQYVLPY